MDAIPSAEEEMAQTIDLLAHAVRFFALSQSLADSSPIIQRTSLQRRCWLFEI